MIPGFDSRSWDGKLPSPTAYRFFIAKVNEISQNYYGFFNYRLWDQYAGAKSGGLDFGTFCFHRQTCSPRQLAQSYRKIAGTLGAVDFPPCVDAEDRNAVRGQSLANHLWASVQEVEQAFGEMTMIYSASWWWDYWVKPWLPAGHPIYLRPLWECDPPPATPNPGYFGTPAGTQDAIDIIVPGYNAKIDTNKFREDWYIANVRPRAF